MSTISYYYILAIMLLPYVLPAQESIQVGAGLHVQLPVTVNPVVGAGSSGQLWATLPLSPNWKVRAALGYQSYGGYEHGYMRYENIVQVNGQTQRLHHIEVNGLSFVSIDLGIVLGEGRSTSKWSYALSARLATLWVSKGVEHESSIDNYAVYRSPLSADLPSGGGTAGGAADPLSDEILSGYDLGVECLVRYRLANGLQAQFGAYQGLLNQWSSTYPGSNALFVSSFSLGLSARIF